MSSSTQKRRISVTVDARLLDKIDKLTDNRSAALEEGLHLWYTKQVEEKLRKFYQNRSQADIEFEEEWVRATQDQAIAGWDDFPWEVSAKND